MKSLALFTILNLLLCSYSFAQVCDQDEIIKLMAESDYINLEDPAFCLDLESFPNVRVKMAEGNYEINEQRTITEKLNKQDDSIKRIVELLNSTSISDAGENFTVQATGISDGTFNSSKKHDAVLLKELGDASGLITTDKIASVIESQDPEAAKIIIEEIVKHNKKLKKADNSPVKFSDFNDDSRGKSLMRNFFLARSRGDKLCNDIFGGNTYCQSKGQTSPSLDLGEECYKGCCDQRRGAYVDIMAPQKENKSIAGNGKFKPPFKSPSRSYQGKMQMAGSLSVFSLPLKDDVVLEDEILNQKKTIENLDKDRARFREAMAGTGCESNDFAVDAVRRIYWSIRGMKERISPELYSSILKNDFNATYQLYQKAISSQNKNDLNIFSTLFSGGNTNVAKNNKIQCPKILNAGENWGSDDRSGITFKKNPYDKCLIISDSSELNGKSISDVNKLITSKYNKKDGYIDPDSYVLQDPTSKENFYFYDRKKNIKIHFGFDSKDENCVGLGVPYNLKKSSKRDDEKFSLACIQQATNSSFKLPKEFYPQAPMVAGVTPSDAFNCLDISQALDYEMKDQNPRGQPLISKEAEGSLKPYCRVQSDKMLTMHLEPKGFTPIKNGSRTDYGFVCTGCSKGVQIKNNKFDYDARQTNMEISGKEGNQHDLATKTWSQASDKKSAAGISMASLKHIRSYVIPDCGKTCEDACACLRKGNMAVQLKKSNVEVIDFTDMTNSTSRTVSGAVADKAGSFTCIYTPPVPHTCSFNPLGETSDEQHSLAHEEVKCPIIEKLKSEIVSSKKSKTIVSTAALTKYKQLCSKQSFPSTEEQCRKTNGGAMCLRKRESAGCGGTNAPSPTGVIQQ